MTPTPEERGTKSYEATMKDYYTSASDASHIIAAIHAAEASAARFFWSPVARGALAVLNVLSNIRHALSSASIAPAKAVFFFITQPSF